MAAHAAPVVGRAGAGVMGLAVDERALTARVGGKRPLASLLAKLTVTARPTPGAPHRGPPIRRTAFVREGGDLRLPRRLAPALRRATGPAPPALDALDVTAAAFRPLPAPPADLPAGQQALFPYQAAAAAHLAAHGGPLAPGSFPAVAYLQMDPGFGKTRVGLAVAAARGGPACVVVPTQAIAEQWLDEALAGFPHWRAGQFANSSKRARAVGAASHDLVVVVVNTFRELPPAFVTGFATVVLDEAHELCSEKNSLALWVAQAGGAVLGLSATPLERPDGLDRLVVAHLGAPVIAGEIPAVAAGVAAIAWRARVRTIEFAGAPGFGETVTGPGGTASAILTIAAAAADPARVRLIAGEIARLARAHELPPEDPGRRGLPPGTRHGVFVFAEHREFLLTLRDAVARFLAPDDIILADDQPDQLDPLDQLDQLDPPVQPVQPVQPVRSAPVAMPPALPGGDAGDDEGDDAADDPSVLFAALLSSDCDDIPDQLDPTEQEDTAELELPAELEHSAELKDTAAPRGDHTPISVLRGGAAAGEVGRARAAGAHVVLTTYGYSRRGISLPEMTALVLATPRRNGSRQILGRVFRRGGDPAIERVIVDVVDTRTCLKSQYGDRRKIYRAFGWPIERIQIDHLDVAP